MSDPQSLAQCERLVAALSTLPGIDGIDPSSFRCSSHEISFRTTSGGIGRFLPREMAVDLDGHRVGNLGPIPYADDATFAWLHPSVLPTYAGWRCTWTSPQRATLTPREPADVTDGWRRAAPSLDWINPYAALGQCIDVTFPGRERVRLQDGAAMAVMQGMHTDAVTRLLMARYGFAVCNYKADDTADAIGSRRCRQ